MINLYSENFFFWPKIKQFIKKFLGSYHRGPQAVEESLLRGLEELGLVYSINDKRLPVDSACVISGVQTLKWDIEQKRRGLIKKIIAGPNLVVLPGDAEGIIQDPLIDRIVVPSPWVSELYAHLAPELAQKIRIWPAGVDVPVLSRQEKKYDFLILNKLKGDASLYHSIANHLKNNNFKFYTLFYGSFNQEDYFNYLLASKHLIYLSESESQGLAMFEAWARNVPVFAWERGQFSHGSITWEGLAATPYLNEQSGMRFKNFDEFQSKLNTFIAGAFAPRQYVLDNFSLQFAAKKYLKIINET